MVAVVPNRRRGGAHGRTRGQREIRLRDEARRRARPSGTWDEQAEGREVQTEAGSDPRAAPRGGERVPQGEGRVPGESGRPAGVEVTNREESAIVSTLAGLDHPLRCLLKAAGPVRSPYYYQLFRFWRVGAMPETTRTDTNHIPATHTPATHKKPSFPGERERRLLVRRTVARAVTQGAAAWSPGPAPADQPPPKRLSPEPNQRDRIRLTAPGRGRSCR